MYTSGYKTVMKTLEKVKKLLHQQQLQCFKSDTVHVFTLPGSSFLHEHTRKTELQQSIIYSQSFPAEFTVMGKKSADRGQLLCKYTLNKENKCIPVFFYIA